MDAKREYRGRDETQVSVLDALVDRSEEGMTVFELRSRVGADIDQLESALAELKEDDLIEVADEEGRAVIYPDDRVVPDPGEAPDDPSLVDVLREKLPF